MSKNNQAWKLIGHSHQIADTGDYDGRYEITNGKISIFTQDDDDEALDAVVSTLNDSGCRFYLDDWAEFENRLLKDEISQLKAERDRLKAQIAKLEKRDLWLTALEHAGVDNWEGYNIAVDIFDEFNTEDESNNI